MAVLTSNEIDQYLFLLRDLTWRALEGAEDLSSLKKRFGQLLRQRYPAESQLQYAYLVLLAHLLELPPLPILPHQLPNGSTCLDTLGLGCGDQVPELTHIAELGSLWMILGHLLKNETLLYAGIKMAVWQAHTLDHQGVPHYSLWSRAASFNAHQLAAYNDLLFSLGYRLTKENGFSQAAHLQLPQGRDSTSLPAKLLMLVDEKAAPIKLSYRPLAEEITVGLLKFSTPHWSMACSLSGYNSGLFSYHKKNVSILNAGPQKAPLDDLETFGIDRACSLKTRGFPEVIWEKTSHHFRLKGWTKLHATPTWMEADCYFQAQKLNVSCFFQEERPREALVMAFYCRCDKIVIGGKTSLQAGSLERYQGKSLPLELCSGEEVIFIEPLEEQTMEIIPLSGGDYFWGAQFLIAFPVEKNSLRYSIK